MALYIFNLLTSIIYLVSLKYISVRLYLFGHYSGKYSRGFIAKQIGEILNSFFGIIIAYLFFDFIESRLYQPMITALLILKGSFASFNFVFWLFVLADGFLKLFKIGGTFRHSKLKEDTLDDEDNQISIAIGDDSEALGDMAGKCYGKIDC